MIKIGCDIHILCEYRKDKDSPWINCDSFRINPRILTKEDWDNYKPDEKFSYDPRMWREQIYNGRDYELFGLLADVRSIGPAIKEPCGVPDDMHWLTQKYVYNADRYSHSHTYYYATELINAYDKMKHRWKKAKKKADKIENDGFDKYAVDKDGSFLGDNHYKRLEGIINPMKHLMYEYLYCFDEEDCYEKGRNFRLIMFFDS